MANKSKRKRLLLLQWGLTGVFLLTLLAGWFAPETSELWVRSLFWGLLWPTLTVSALLLFGPLFCSLCPLGVLGRRISRLGLGLRLPRRMSWIGWSALTLLCGYWLVSIMTAGYARLPLKYTLAFFSGLLLLMLLMSVRYRAAPFCRSFCPFAILVKIFGQSGWVKLVTREQSKDVKTASMRQPMASVCMEEAVGCKACPQADCARVCPQQLLPSRVARGDLAANCNLCLECYQACERLQLAIGPRQVRGQSDSSVTVALTLFILFALVAIQTQLQHRWDKGPWRELMPWHALDSFLASQFSLPWLETRSLALALCALITTLALVAVSLMAAHALSGKSWRTLLVEMARIPVPLVLCLLLSHGLMSFASRGAPGLIEGLGRIFGANWVVAGLERNSALMPLFGALLWFGVILSLRRGWLLGADRAKGALQRLTLWLLLASPVFLFLGLRWGGMLLTAPAPCH